MTTPPHAHHDEVVGARIILESERATRPARVGVIVEVSASPPPAYRVLWDDGHRSILRPSAGCAIIAGTRLADESTFRAINDRIRHLGAPWPGTLDFVCECADIGCTQLMRLDPREYDEVRAGADRFAVIPGHELVHRERVVGRTDRHVVVRRLH
jgi:hypothetical protein